MSQVVDAVEHGPTGYAARALGHWVRLFPIPQPIPGARRRWETLERSIPADPPGDLAGIFLGEQRGIGHHPELAVLLLEHAEEIDFWREQFELRQLDSVIVSMEILHLWRQAGETCHAALEAHELDPDVQAALLMRAAEAFDWAWMPRERDAALDLLVHEHADSVEGRKAAKWRERLPPPGP